MGRNLNQALWVELGAKYGGVPRSCIPFRWGHGGLRYCGIGLFLCGISVILILTYGIAVSSSSAVCGFSSFLLTVFGEIGLFTVLRYRLFALSFRYTDAKQNTVGHKGQ